MSGPEKRFENKIKKYLKEQGCYFVKYWGGGQFTRSGVPDILACIGGRFVGIEVKSETGKVSELQDYHKAKINVAGGIGLVLRPKDFEKFKSLVKELKNE